jgi:hypothetical protein
MDFSPTRQFELSLGLIKISFPGNNLLTLSLK